MIEGEAEVMHLWWLGELPLGPGAVSTHMCELGGEALLCPPAEHPAEC